MSIATKTPLRLLHLEDDAKDAELIRATLEAAGFAPEIVVVQTKADYLAQLDHGWELILSDYKLPQFDGLQALALFKERGLDISFILISGTIGEEAAVAAMQAGASDYVLKSHLARLGSAVDRGLRETIERRTRKQSETLIAGQKQVLEMIAYGEPLGATLDALLRLVEAQAPDMLCSILLLDAEGVRLRHGAAPSLPEVFTQAIDGVAIGPAVGSCGTAAFRGEAVIVEDLATDPLWADYRAVALPHGLRACWSTPILDERRRVLGTFSPEVLSARTTPIFDERRRVLGTFAIYFRQPGLPTARHHHLIEIATQTAAVCLLHHQAARRLREQAELLDQARDAIFVTSLDDRITFWNQGAERILGWTATEALGRTAAELSGPWARPEVAILRQTVLATGTWHGEVLAPRKDGQRIVLDLRVTLVRDEAGRPVSHLSIGTDITEKKQFEELSLRAQRLENIGLLAAGISHDLNNVLAPISMAVSLLRHKLSESGDLRLLDILEKSGERGAGLVRQILGFVHGIGGEPRPVQVKHLLHDITVLIQETFPKSITLEEHVSSDLWPIMANPTQIHQILLNLCVNARDAMPDGGTLRVRAENQTLDQATAQGIEGARPGNWLVLEVGDTGTGIPAEILKDIWRPFFTTKAPGKGTGLGLSTIRGIVERHEGFITLTTAPGRGTTFRVYLPPMKAETGPDPMTATERTPAGHGELILVVDDEESIRDIAAAALRNAGYRVVTARDGAEAAALLLAQAGEIKLVLTDIEMPKLDGAGLAQAVHAMNPAIRVVAMSGRDLKDLAKDARLGHFLCARLQKPFEVGHLLRVIHEQLHGHSAPP